MTDRVRISVVIPCFNGARFLRQTLESVVRQTYRAHEIIVVDDGSTDDSAAIAESFGPLVRVIRQPNQGESVARNCGIEEACGEWVAFLDADDLWEPEKLERQAPRMSNGAVAVCTGARIRDEEAGRIVSDWNPVPESFTEEQMLGASCPCNISSVVVKRTLSIRFPVWTRYAEDALYLLELARLGPMEIVSEPLVIYRRHTKSQSVANRDIETRWHDSFDRWIVEHSNIESALERNRLRALAVRRLTTLLEKAYWQRDWDQVDILESYLRSRPDVPGRGSIRHRRFPRWCYRMKDLLDRAIGKP